METVRELVARAARAPKPEQRAEAFGHLVQRFADMAVGYAYARLRDFHLAQDAAQEAFLTAFRRLSGLRKPEAFPAWLRKVVRTACDHVARRRTEAPAPPGLDAPSGQAGPAEEAQTAETRNRVLAAVNALPAPQREATTLFYIDGYSQEQVAEFLGVPATTVNSRLAAARKRLKDRLIAMVKDTLHDAAPDPAALRDRTEFLLAFAAQVSDGVQILRALEACRARVRTPRVKAALAEIHDDIAQRRLDSLAQAMRKHPDLFPPVVLSLVADGEHIGTLDLTLRYAGQWLLEGRYQPDPFLFQRCMWDGRTVAQALALGAVSLTVRNIPWDGPRTRDSRPPDRPWALATLFDGRDVPIEPDMFHVSSGVYEAMKLNTVLDAVQSGDVQTGLLRTRPDPAAPAESFFRIRFDLTAGAGEAHVDLAPVSPPA